MELQRGILVFALAFVLLIIYQRWLEETSPPKPTPVAEQTAPTSASEVPSAPAAVPGEVPAAPAAPQAERTEPAGPHTVVTTDLLHVEISALGGDINKLLLIKYPVSLDTPDRPFALIKRDAADIFSLQSGLIGHDQTLPNHRTTYRLDAEQYTLKPGQDSITVPLHYDSPTGVRYTKLFTFSRNSYQIRVEYSIDNQSTSDWDGYMYAQFLRTEVVQKRGFFMDVVPSYLGGAIYTPEDKFEKIQFSEMREGDLNREVASGWVAMLQHYFVGAWFPTAAGPMQFYSKVLQETGGPRYALGLKTLRPTNVAPGARVNIAVDLYAGPKEQDRLDKQAEGFGLTVDYGWLTPVSVPLFWILEKIHGVVGNWGWAIIALTCLIKLAFYPLSAASYKSMAKMKRLQPRLQTLKERYGDDKAKLNQAMMELYKKDKVNPLGGCLPILIQIPVFIALYWVLLESVELRQAPWILWIKDLSLKDPFFVLPILMGATMVAQQFLNPSPLDPMQKKIMMAMPVVFTFLFLYFPAGLVLYWLVNNMLSIAQQWYINRTYGEKS